MVAIHQYIIEDGQVLARLTFYGRTQENAEENADVFGCDATADEEIEILEDPATAPDVMELREVSEAQEGGDEDDDDAEPDEEDEDAEPGEDDEG